MTFRTWVVDGLHPGMFSDIIDPFRNKEGNHTMTIKLYDQDSHLTVFSAALLSCVPTEDGRYHILLDRTAFFPEGGGQPADRGTLTDGETVVQVLDTQETSQGILHLTDGPLPTGQVTGEIDWPLRFVRMQCHSGEHIVSGLAHSMFGCTNVGFHMGEDAVILDFDKELTGEQIQTLEDEVNRVIWTNRPVTAEYPDPAILAGLDYRSKLDLTDNVRIVTIEGVDQCACCAPHVCFTGEIGLVKLLTFMRHRGGVRIWMVAGSQALRDYQSKHNSVTAISAALSVKQPEVAQGVERLKQTLADTEFSLTGAKRALATEKIKALPQTEGNICLFEEGLDPNTLRSLVNAGMEKCGGICAAFTGSDETGYRYVMGSRSVDLRAESKVIHSALGGKGGGQPAMIQGSVSASREEIEAYFA